MGFEDAMHEILQGRRYDTLMGRSRDIWRTIMDSLQQLFTALFDRLQFAFPRGTGDMRAVPVIFGVLGGVLLLVGAAVLVRAFLRTRQRRSYDLSDIFAELAGSQYTVAELLRLSTEANTRRSAVRYRYIAVLLALDEADIIHIAPSATNALILHTLREAHPVLVPDFTRVAHTYHLSWYGFRDIDDSAYVDFTDSCTVFTGVHRG